MVARGGIEPPKRENTRFVFILQHHLETKLDAKNH